MFDRKTTLLVLAVVALPTVHPVDAQTSTGSTEIRATGGFTKIFLDEPAHLTVGGSVRYYLTRRFAVQPGMSYYRSEDYEEWAALPDVVFDFPRPGGRVTPHVIGGLGLLRCHDKRIDYTSTELSASGGFGVKIFLTPRLFVAPEVRLGSHAFPQATFSIGFLLSGSRQ
jgi:hypothetical protein